MDKKDSYKRSIPQKAAKIGYYPNSASISVAKLVEKNCRIIGLTNGQFSLIDLIHDILKKVGRSEVWVCTWSAGIKDLRTVEWMKHTSLLKSFKLIVDHSYVSRKKEYIAEISTLFGDENIITSEIHAKFVLIGNEDYRVIIRTSMNLNANKTCESFEIDEDFEIYSFYHNFIENLQKNSKSGFVKESSSVNKSLKKAFNENNGGQRRNFRFN
jgi:hypothetical protein